ncbi:MAG: FlgB family protein [Rhodobacteraceae bacterium]|nr:FlgB family protein [Paracoccaceae bacterium]
MFNGLAIFKTASALASHAMSRQSVVARNIANADTPGYVARDLSPFSETYENAQPVGPDGTLRTTRPGHVAHARFGTDPTFVEAELAGDASPNGNTVSLETEMIKSAEIRQQHDLALATYRGGLDLLRTALGRGR